MIQEAKGGSQGMRITFCELSDEEVAALAKAGNEEAALKGLKKILRRKGIVIEDRKFKNGATYSIYK